MRMYNHPENYFYAPGDFLIGDKGYVISRRMIIPYSKPLENQQQDGYVIFNSHLTKT